MEKRSGEREQQAHIGVIFAILGNMAISIALNVQKYVHNEIGKRTVTRRTPPSRTTSKPEEENLLLPENSIEHQNNIEYIENVHKTNYSITNDNNELDYLQEPRWWLGISLMFLGELGNFLGRKVFFPLILNLNIVFSGSTSYMDILIMIMIIIIIFVIMTFIHMNEAYGYAPAILVTPLGTVALVCIYRFILFIRSFINSFSHS